MLLWALWLVMTLLLLAAGVAVFGGEPTPAPSPGVPPPNASASATRAVLHDQDPALPTATRQLDTRNLRSDVPVRARVVVCLRTSCNQTVPLPRGVVVGVNAFREDAPASANGQRLGQRQPPTPWTFTVPAGTARLRFECYGFAPLEVAMPAATDGIADLGSIALQAEASIRLRLVHAPAALRQGATATIGTAANARVATTPIGWRGDCGEALLPAPSGQPLYLHVLLPPASGMALRLPDEVTRAAHSLQRGETRTIEVDLQQLPACTLQLTGIADELLPHVEIAMHECGRREQLLTADADGRVQILGLPSDAVAFDVRGPDPMAGNVDLRTRELLGWFGLLAGATYELRPVEPLLGIGMRDARGRSVPFELGLDQPTSLAEARQLQIVSEVRLRRMTTLFVDTEGARCSVPPSALVGAGAVRWITPAAMTPLATLRVRPTTPLPDQHGFYVGFEALDRDGSGGGMPQQGDCFVCDQVLPGRYRVGLWYRDSRTFDIASDLTLRPGSITELPLELPAVRQWHGEIANWSELSAALRPHAVFLGGGRVKVGDDGNFTWQRAGALPAGTSMMVGYFQSDQLLPGRLLDLDPLGCRVRVAAPMDVAPLQLRAQSLGDGNTWFAWAKPKSPQVVMSQYGEFWLPVAISACGYTCEDLRGSLQVTAWFTLPPGTTNASIPTGVDARWLTVNVQRPVRRFAVRVRGPEGLPVAAVTERAQRGSVSVLIVAGTRIIEVETDGEVQTFEPALGDVVIR